MKTKAIPIILGVIILILLGVLIFVPAKHSNPAPATSTTTTTGSEDTATSTALLHAYTSSKGKTVNAYLAPGQKVGSPLTITGNVPAGWAFEASFPVTVRDADGEVIGQSTARVPNWMSTSTAWYTLTVSFGTPKTATGWVILWNDNPSGLAANADAAEIPVTF